MSSEKGQKCLKGKLVIEGTLRVQTGMHIGGGDDFSPIGSVDSPFIRDTLTHQPIIPGSSLKGKIRTLLVRNLSKTYVLNIAKNDPEIIKRMFGSSDPVMASRLQFMDLFVSQNSKEKFEEMETDTYLGEVKFENTISRTSGVANPRQIERVPAGMEFDFKLVYNVEAENEVKEDLQMLSDGLKLLETDYLGGHGSQGYGRVTINNLHIKPVLCQGLDPEKYLQILK